jgi:hypothetical protein
VNLEKIYVLAALLLMAIALLVWWVAGLPRAPG